MRSILVAAAFVITLVPAASAQKWKDIGKTASGNMVSVDERSVKRKGDTVFATVRVVFTEPVKAARGMWKSSKTSAMFDCRKRYLAAKENVFYSDEKGTKVVERSVNKLPGFGPGLSGSLGGIAVDYLCGPKK
ncbi:hypothetical protein BH09GEM1_BH09GEM1_25720 [soil metagenome]